MKYSWPGLQSRAARLKRTIFQPLLRLIVIKFKRDTCPVYPAAIAIISTTHVQRYREYRTEYIGIIVKRAPEEHALLSFPYDGLKQHYRSAV